MGPARYAGFDPLLPEAVTESTLIDEYIAYPPASPETGALASAS